MTSFLDLVVVLSSDQAAGVPHYPQHFLIEPHPAEPDQTRLAELLLDLLVQIGWSEHVCHGLDVTVFGAEVDDTVFVDSLFSKGKRCHIQF
jgi:hypothetical protein